MHTDSLTDLIGGVILLPMIAALCAVSTQKKDERRLWLWFFSLLAASCLTGYISHRYLEPRGDMTFELS